MNKKYLSEIVDAIEGSPASEAERGITDIKTKHNHLYFYADVYPSSALELINQLHEVDNQCQWDAQRLHIDAPAIWLHVRSYGGSLFDGFAIYDAIQATKTPTYTICEGIVASAGTLISIAGKKRFIRPSAYLMVHQLQSGFWGTYEQFKDEKGLLDMLMERLYTIYASHSKMERKDVIKALKRDTWMDANKALELGFVDEILT